MNSLQKASVLLVLSGLAWGFSVAPVVSGRISCNWVDDWSGTWAVDVIGPDGNVQETFQMTLRQEGYQVTGTFKWKKDGTIKGIVRSYTNLDGDWAWEPNNPTTAPDGAINVDFRLEGQEHDCGFFYGYMSVGTTNITVHGNKTGAAPPEGSHAPRITSLDSSAQVTVGTPGTFSVEWTQMATSPG